MSPVLLAPDHGALVMPGEPRLAALFPHAIPLPTGQLVVPHEPTEVRVLRNIGFDVPSPILHGYDWCGTVPFHAQKVTAGMLVVEPRAFVLSTMGTGKTRSALYAFDWLRKRKLVKRMLIVAPLSTLNFVWAREVMSVMPTYKVGILFGSAERRRKILRDTRFDIYVINHDGFSTIRNEVSARPDINVLVLDEAAVYRNARTKKFKELKPLIDAGKFKYVWAMTGTPTPREPTDAYGLIRLVNPQAYPHSFTRFRDLLMVKVSNFKWLPRRGSEAKVFELMQPAVRFTMADCQDMPPVTYTDHEIKLTPKQHQVYEALRKHCRMMFESGQVSAANGGVLLNKLLQVSGGCVYNDRHEAIMLDATPRLQETRDLVFQNDRKTLIFVPYIPMVDLVGDFLKEAGVIVHRVSGSTPKAERDRIFQTFQSQPIVPFMPEVIVAHPKTMAHGLTLTEANMVLWYAPLSDLEIYEQANARVVRPGQTANHVTIRHLVGSRTEQAAYRRLSQRQEVQDALLELFEEE